jgi:AcrR family transcriptional regulator
MKKPQPAVAPETMRKMPTQQRALQTIETIFQATAQILETEGEAALSTNKVAQKAGFSIGTLYQYFPSKEAILLAMVNRERRRVMDQLEALLHQAELTRPEPEVLLRQFIHINTEGFGAGPGGAAKSRRALIRVAWRMDQHEVIAQALRETTERIAIALQQLNHPALRPPTPALMFVVTRAVIGVIRSASMEQSPLLGSQALDDELFQLAWGVMAVDPRHP